GEYSKQENRNWKLEIRKSKFAFRLSFGSGLGHSFSGLRPSIFELRLPKFVFYFEFRSSTTVMALPPCSSDSNAWVSTRGWASRNSPIPFLRAPVPWP